ncbi:hypothetical protein F511_12900 [Dorcoceras hygrometricum]|uniref:Uncharacterized protein n=1 Tax=Dorcoceras hygrometricum TaxID=472368 RepID=A0A2Z7CYT2_9LAMI|nr:hypothetical protein F511_12900 [Dorcoceras hygrometricum]
MNAETEGNKKSAVHDKHIPSILFISLQLPTADYLHSMKTSEPKAQQTQEKRRRIVISADDEDQQMKRSAKMKRRRVEIQQMLLELAIAKRCRLHELIRQRFALAINIQQEDVAMEIISRREDSAGSNSTSSRCEIQSQDSVARFSRSAREAVVDLNQQERSS